MNLNRFYSILATIEHFKFRTSSIMGQFVTFRKRVCTPFCDLVKTGVYRDSVKDPEDL